jgi:hypothetical protein
MIFDLQTVGGVIALSVFLTAFLVKILKVDDNDAKKLISAGLAIVIGIFAHLSGLGFQDSTIIILIGEILASVFGSKLAYDSLVKPVSNEVKKKGK